MALDKPTTIEYGVVAEFSDPDQLVAAAQKTYDAGYRKIDAYTPFPVHGLGDAIGFDCGKVPWTIFIFGVIGGLSGLGLQAYVSMRDYPLNVGGRPLFSWPSFIPVTFECTVLFAALAAVIGMFAFNGLPKPYHPIFNTPNFERATEDKFFLCIEARDGQYQREEARSFLKGLGADNVSDVWAEEVFD